MVGHEGLRAVRLPVGKDGFRTNYGHRWQPFFCEASGPKNLEEYTCTEVAAEPVASAAPSRNLEPLTKN